MFWRWQGKRYNLRVIPDEAPLVSFAAPRDMLSLLLSGATSATMTVSVKDDYAVRRAVLHMTLARGSGENIRFQRPRSAAAGVGRPARAHLVEAMDAEGAGHGAGRRTVLLRARGRQRRTAPCDGIAHLHAAPSGPGRSGRRIDRAADAGQAGEPAQPAPDHHRYRTADRRCEGKSVPAWRHGQGAQRSHRQRPGHAAPPLRPVPGRGIEPVWRRGARAAQRQGRRGGRIRARARPGRERDPVRRSDQKVLRRALSAMWDAEKHLRAITPRSALPPEYKALEAIKELQQADRIYLHKTAFVPPAIKEEIRMTGDVVGTKSYRRAQGGPGEGVPPELRALLQALSSDAALPALWSRTAHDWIRSRIASDEERLEAQRAVQDVADGCVAC
ncbi:hypothetical protein LP420_17415 [Massilia sp. B-10]|nr:hypothetical protein LP420_17415 [Massilia sp. B-10]